MYGTRRRNFALSAVCDKRRLQTCRLADSKICRPTFFVTGLWANFIHPLFTVGESQSMSEANNSASGLQTQQCPIRQVTGNSCRGRLNTSARAAKKKTGGIIERLYDGRTYVSRE